MADVIVLDTPEQIKSYRILTLKAALKLEIKGMKRRGRSVYSIVKEEFGFKGNKQKVYDQLCHYISEHILNDTGENNDSHT